MNEVLEKIQKIGIVPVVVLDDAKDAAPLAKALCEGGLPCAEVTFRTAAAEESIRIMAKEFPEMELTKKHHYIRSRIEQEEVALSFAKDGEMDVAVLELPYIFGTQPGRKPVWVILIEQLTNMGKTTMYPKGGTAMVTVRQVGEAIVGAAEKNVGGNAYPIGYYNLTWDEFLRIVHRAMGQPNRKIIHIAKWMFKAFGVYMMNEYKKRNVESGINAVYLADIMCMNTFINKKWSVSLGVQEDDIESAIFDSVKLSVDAFTGKQKLLEMKGE